MKLRRGDMESFLALSQDLAVIDYRTLGRHHLRDGVGEIGFVFQSDVGLDERKPTMRPGQDQVPGMGDTPFAARRGHEDEVDRFFDSLAFYNRHKSTVADKRRVESCKRVIIV